MWFTKYDIDKLISKSWKWITIHTTATYPGQDHDVDSIRKMHIKRKFSDIGYHVLIKLDGTIQIGRPWNQYGAHVKGHNSKNFGIVLVGGLDEKGKAKNTYSPEQMESLKEVLDTIVGILGIEDGNIKGHRDWSPDLNGNGKVDKHEWLKECPCFDVAQFLEERKH